MESLVKLRRRRLVKNEAISAIARDLNVSRNTVKKYLKEDAELGYQRTHQPNPKLGAFMAQLDTWLDQDGQRPKGQRRTAKRLFEDLQREGYLGGYDSVQRHVKRWKARSPAVSDAFVPLSFPPGDVCQFDWSHESVELGGAIVTVKVAHFRLTHSRLPFLVAYPRETLEMVFDAHVRAFAFYGGVPDKMVYDNPKTIVKEIFVGKNRTFNPRFLALAKHYLFEPVACTPASGWEKGQVENQVGNVREWLFVPRPSFPDLAALNAWLEQRCRAIGERSHPEFKDRSIADCFATEQPHLRLVNAPFRGYSEHSCRISSTCLASHDRNRYSVPAEYAGKAASLRAFADRIVVVVDGQPVAEHARNFGRDQYGFDPWHYLPVLERKPGALRHGAPFQDWVLPAAIGTIRTRLMKLPQGDRAFVEILVAMRQHGSELVNVACELALEHRTVTGPIILNHIHRLASPDKSVSCVATHLTLKENPAANCSRYDALREVPHAD